MTKEGRRIFEMCRRFKRRTLRRKDSVRLTVLVIICCTLWLFLGDRTSDEGDVSSYVAAANDGDNDSSDHFRHEGLYSREKHMYYLTYRRGAHSFSYRDRDPCKVPIANPIVIVGSDGSGTRVPSLALTRMGVTLLVTPSVAHQMDVDGSGVGLHFTPLIRKILCKTGGRSDYDLSEFTSEFREDILRAFDPWVAYIESQACDAALEHDSARDRGTPFKWGFKKPDLLNLLPVMRFYWHDLKIVHVVRDGRDMALSRNQAAFEKYGPSIHGVGCDSSTRAPFRVTFPWHPLPSPLNPPWLAFPAFSHESVAVRKARLWALQNMGVARYLSLLENERTGTGSSSRTRSTTRRSSSLSTTLRIRLEDLNDEGRVGFGSYKSLSSFVKSRLRTCDVCTLREQMQSNFMGSFDSRLRGAAEAASKIAKRQYGKWKSLVNENATLLFDIQGHVGTSLQWFGYVLFDDRTEDSVLDRRTASSYSDPCRHCSPHSQ